MLSKFIHKQIFSCSFLRKYNDFQKHCLLSNKYSTNRICLGSAGLVDVSNYSEFTFGNDEYKIYSHFKMLRQKNISNRTLRSDTTSTKSTVQITLSYLAAETASGFCQNIFMFHVYTCLVVIVVEVKVNTTCWK